MRAQTSQDILHRSRDKRQQAPETTLRLSLTPQRTCRALFFAELNLKFPTYDLSRLATSPLAPWVTKFHCVIPSSRVLKYRPSWLFPRVVLPTFSNFLSPLHENQTRKLFDSPA